MTLIKHVRETKAEVAVERFGAFISSSVLFSKNDPLFYFKGAFF
jgi:hypothetical protein